MKQENRSSLDLIERNDVPAHVLATRLVEAVSEGIVDALEAHVKISRIEDAIKLYKGDDRIRDLTLRELAKYGKKYLLGDCCLEEIEAGIRYDFSNCGDSLLNDLYQQRETISMRIKERESLLKSIPTSGMVDPLTGEVIYPPIKTSKTVIKTMFTKPR